MQTYKDLEVYKKSYRLALEIYKLSLTLPKELQYDIADDIRRASRSIPSNIAEGYSRKKSAKDISSYLKISLGSSNEVLFNLEFIKDLGLSSPTDYDYLTEEFIICSKQLNRLIASLTK